MDPKTRLSREEDRIRELEDALQVLAQENQQLAERAEDMLLLGLIAEKVAQIEDRQGVMETGLEEVSMLKDLPFCAWGTLEGGILRIQDSYLAFAQQGPGARQGALPATWLSRRAEGAVCYGPANEGFQQGAVLAKAPGFEPAALMVIPFHLQSGEDGLFLFADSDGPDRLNQLTMMLVRATEMLVARLDHVYLVRALREMNAGLDRKVAARTVELERVNAHLQTEIQDRERIEQRLREGESRFRSTFEQAAVGMCHADLEGAFVRVNQRFCDIVGYTQEELLTRDFREITHPDDLAKDLVEVDRLLQGETRTFSMEKRYLRKDGGLCWVDLTVSLLRDERDRPVEFIGVIEDITQRRQVEEQLRQAQKLEGIGQLAGGVAHDFNNLLTVIQGHVSLLLADETIPETAREQLRELGESATRASGLTRQLLTFSRRRPLQVEVLDLNQVLIDLLRMLRRVLGEQVALQFQPAPGTLWTQADLGMVEQVVVNLAVNARDAMPRGGTLAVATRRQSVTREMCEANPEAKEGDWVCVALADNGCGMSPEVLIHVFEPFFTTKEIGKGTGLGLATVHGIAKQHNGWIEVESQVGLGTEFRFYLPSCSAVDLPTRAAPPVTPRRGRQEVILLVEDEEFVRNMARLTLTRLGYRVLTAGDGEQALRVWEEHGDDIALLLTDMVMPGGMSGVELARQLRELRPALPVIVTSGYSLELATDSEALPEDCRYLPKPYDAQHLGEVVGEALQTSGSQPGTPKAADGGAS